MACPRSNSKITARDDEHGKNNLSLHGFSGPISPENDWERGFSLEVAKTL